MWDKNEWQKIRENDLQKKTPRPKKTPKSRSLQHLRGSVANGAHRSFEFCLQSHEVSPNRIPRIMRNLRAPHPTQRYISPRKQKPA